MRRECMPLVGGAAATSPEPSQSTGENVTIEFRWAGRLEAALSPCAGANEPLMGADPNSVKKANIVLITSWATRHRLPTIYASAEKVAFNPAEQAARTIQQLQASLRGAT
jgi:hypothetical protein